MVEEPEKGSHEDGTYPTVLMPPGLYLSSHFPLSPAQAPLCIVIKLQSLCDQCMILINCCTVFEISLCWCDFKKIQTFSGNSWALWCHRNYRNVSFLNISDIYLAMIWPPFCCCTLLLYSFPCRLLWTRKERNPSWPSLVNSLLLLQYSALIVTFFFVLVAPHFVHINNSHLLRQDLCIVHFTLHPHLCCQHKIM